VPLGLEELQEFLANFGRFHRAASNKRKRRVGYCDSSPLKLIFDYTG
jgi:hypothetical protein